MRRALLAPVVALVLAAAPLAAQETTCLDAGDKSPTTARVVGILPGAGHIYACEFMHGIAYFIVTTGFIGLGAGAAALDCLSTLSDDRCGRQADVALVAAIGVWAWSIYDAGRAAQRTNAKRRQQRVSPIVTPVGPKRTGEGSRRALKVGLSVWIR